MMKILLAIGLFFLSTISGVAQEYKIKGRIVLGQYLAPVGGVYVGFDFPLKFQTSPEGRFEITANEQQINDTLKIYLLGYNQISIINFPKDSVLNLGTIPIYEYFYGVPLIHFDCGALNFVCKKKRRKFWENYESERTSYFKKMDTIIGHYRMFLNGKSYAISFPDHLIDLSKPIEE
ncbi:hypothetical protein GCM10027443_17440 [Pontibacter brevis]